MKQPPRNHVARAMRLAGKSAVAHGRTHKQQRRRDRTALQRALRQGREVFRRACDAGPAQSLPPAAGQGVAGQAAMRRRNPSGTGAGRRTA